MLFVLGFFKLAETGFEWPLLVGYRVRHKVEGPEQKTEIELLMHKSQGIEY